MKILFISPHTDDTELGCGAIINKFNEQGNEIRIIALSYIFYNGNKTIVLKNEFKNAMKILNINKYKLYNFDVRNFDKQRQQILDTLIMEYKNYEPNTVFIPMSCDIHQDHYVVHQEAKRAFKNCTLLGYELPWNNYAPILNYFIPVSEKNIKTKNKVFNCYKSQQNRAYGNKDYFKSLALIRGLQCNNKYAEAFEVIKCIHNI